MTQRDRTREARKRRVLESFAENETIYTNQVAKRAGIVWSIADGLLRDLVAEGQLDGNKEKGYSLHRQTEPNLVTKVKTFLHIK